MKKMPYSLRKYIRRKKALIRRDILDIKEQARQIELIYQKINN